MKHIEKVPEPYEFKTYRARQNATYSDMPTSVKTSLRSALLVSQGFLCCYCMQRVTEDNCKIEHYKCQRIYNGKVGGPDLTLSYSNLFIACNGNEGNGWERLTCDSRKGSDELNHIQLTSVSLDTTFKYGSDGTISTIIEAPDVTSEIDKILNLNEDTLKRNRKTIYDGIMQQMQQAHKNGKYGMPFLQKTLKHWKRKDENNKYQPFCMVAIYVIQKHIDKYKKQNKI